MGKGADMGKGDRRNSKPKKLTKRARHETPGGNLLALAAVKRRATRGRKRMREIEADVQSVAIAARMRRMGLDPAEDDRAIAQSQAAGSPQGRVIIAEGGKDWRDLWNTYSAAAAAYERYCAVMGVSPYAKSQRIDMMPERLEITADDAAPDTRTPDEKERAARDAWSYWRCLIGSLSTRDASSFWAGFYGWGIEADGGGTTAAGGRFVRAVKIIFDDCQRH